jgi:hypothetical protein
MCRPDAEKDISLHVHWQQIHLVERGGLVKVMVSDLDIQEILYR